MTSARTAAGGPRAGTRTSETRSTGHPARRIGITRPGVSGATGGLSAPARLVCIPYAGGNGLAYAPWGRTLSANGVTLYTVDLPGRLGRIAQPPHTTLDELVTELADEIKVWSAGGVFQLFGHSLGALVCYELARELARRGDQMLQGLIVSGFPAPHRLTPREPLADLSDVQLLDHVFSMDGTPVSARVDPELTSMLVRTYRADVTLLDRYHFREGPALDIPVSVFGGNADLSVTLTELRAWQVLARLPIRVSLFPGGHFFPWSGEGIADAIAGELRRRSGRACPTVGDRRP